MQLIDKTTGDRVDVPDDQAQAAFQSGQFGVEAGSRIPVTLADGRTGTVEAKDLHKTLQTGGQIASAQDFAAAQAAKAEAAQQEQYGAGLGSLHGLQQLQNTAAEGLARGLLPGVADVATLHIAEAIGGPAAREKLRADMEARKAANPWIAGATELGGAVAPMFIPGGQAGAVKGAATLAKGAGEAAELAKLAGTGAELARGGAEAAKVASLGEEAVKTATALPRALDFAGGLAERMAKAVVGETSANTVARMVQKGVAMGARGAVEGALYGAGSQISEDALGDSDTTGEKLVAAMGHGALMGGLIGAGSGAAIEGLTTGTRALAKAAAPTAKRIAEEQAMKAVQYGGLTSKKLVQSAERIEGGMAGVGRELLDSNLVKAGDTVEHIAPRLDQAVDEAGQRLTTTLRALDEAGVKGPSTASIRDAVAERMKSQFGDLAELHPETFSKVDKLMTAMDRNFPEGTASLEAMRDFRVKVQNEIKWSQPPPGSPPNSTNEAFKAVRGILEDHIEKAADEGSGKLGKEMLGQYKADKVRYARLRVARDMAEDSVERYAKNNTFGLGAQMAGAATMAGGIASGIGAPLALAKGAAAAVGSKLLKERGNSTAAVFLDKVAELGALAKTVRAVDERANTAMDRFMAGKPSEYSSLRTASKAERDARYEAASQRVKAAVTNPETHADSVTNALGAVVQHAPKAAAIATQTAARASVFLASKIPQAPPSRTIQPQFDKHDPTPAEKEKFLRYVKAADDPLSVLDDMSRGRMTLEGVQTVREVYPSLFSQMQQLAMEKCADAKKPLSYDQKLQLGILLDTPTDSTLQPEFIARMQASYQGQEQSPGDQGPKAAKRPLQNMNQAVALGQRRSG